MLIVEDEPVARRALTALISAHGCVSRAYPSGEEALKSVASNGVPAVALVDFHLPGMNGIEFIKRIESSNGKPLLPILITAAGTDELDRIRRAQPVVCFRKPLDFPRLIALLREKGLVH